MSPFLVAIAAVATAGAVVALATRDGRIATLGLAVALVTAPLVADPLPEPSVLAVRVFGALLVAYVLWIGLRQTGPATRGSAVGWLALGLAATAAFVAGLAGHELVTTIETPAAALAAGLACVVVALVPVVRAREAFRLAVGLVLLLLGITLLRVGLAGSPGALESVATAASLALLATAGIVVAALVHADAGDFELRTLEPELVRRRPTDEATRARGHDSNRGEARSPAGDGPAGRDAPGDTGAPPDSGTSGDPDATRGPEAHGSSDAPGRSGAPGAPGAPGRPAASPGQRHRTARPRRATSTDRSPEA